MKPWQIFVFFMSVVFLLIFLSLLFPREGVKINDDLRLQFFNIRDWQAEDTFQYADISKIIDKVDVTESVEEVPFEDNENETTEGNLSAPFPDTVRAEADSLREITHLISFPGNDPSILYPFFQNITRLKEDNKLIRILHYGDSQIEKDRITGYLRNRFQKGFGGSGCGLIPAVPLYNGKMSIKQSYSVGWERKTGFGRRDTGIQHNKYGALFAFSKIAKYSASKSADEWLLFEPSPIAYPRARQFNRISLFVGTAPSSSLNMKVYLGDSLVDQVYEVQKPDYSKFSWQLSSTPENIRFEVKPDESLSVYAVSLDNQWGLAVDNIPMRGSAGLEFSKSDTSLLRKMYKDLDVGLFLLQFGGNVVPYMKNARQYQKFFHRELKVLRSVSPDIPVIVIGPADMSVKEKGKYVTYPNLEGVRDALKSAALSQNCGFWDMYEAMGGENSMPSWVFAKPSLAVSDFVHFNHRGARIIGEMIYNSLFYEYQRWIDEKSNESIVRNNKFEPMAVDSVVSSDTNPN